MLLAILAIFSLTALMIPHLFVRGFLRRQAPVLAPARYPDVSILKAIKGADDDMYNNFRSHLTQDYPGQVQLIFALEDSLEPAVPHIERLMQDGNLMLSLSEAIARVYEWVESKGGPCRYVVTPNVDFARYDVAVLW